MLIDSLSTNPNQTFTLKHTGSQNVEILLAVAAFSQNNGGDWLITISATDGTLNNTFIEEIAAPPNAGQSACIPLVVEPGAQITIDAVKQNGGTADLRLRACVLPAPAALLAVPSGTAGEFVLVSA